MGHDLFSNDVEEQGHVPPIVLEEPATKKYRCSMSSAGQNDSDEGENRDVYYCMNVVIQSRAFEMNQEIIEGNIMLSERNVSVFTLCWYNSSSI